MGWFFKPGSKEIGKREERMRIAAGFSPDLFLCEAEERLGIPSDSPQQGWGSPYYRIVSGREREERKREAEELLSSTE